MRQGTAEVGSSKPASKRSKKDRTDRRDVEAQARRTRDGGRRSCIGQRDGIGDKLVEPRQEQEQRSRRWPGQDGRAPAPRRREGAPPRKVGSQVQAFRRPPPGPRAAVLLPPLLCCCPLSELVFPLPSKRRGRSPPGPTRAFLPRHPREVLAPGGLSRRALPLAPKAGLRPLGGCKRSPLFWAPL